MNIKELAKLAGVSPSTVSKIVNHKDDSIAQATRERVLQLVRQYHYRPYSSQTPSERTWQLAVLLKGSVAMDTTLDGIISTAQSRGYSTLVFNSFNDRSQECKNIETALSHQVDGIIWEPVDELSLPEGERISKQGVPELTIGPLGDDEFTMLPYEQAAYSLTEELLERHHSNIACLTRPGRRTASFIAGYKRSLFDHELPWQEDLLFSQPNEQLMAAIGNHTVTAVICSHYPQALELYQQAARLHYQVPQDFSILALRNDTAIKFTFPGTTSISSYVMRNADFGAYLCARMINGIEQGRTLAPDYQQTFTLDNENTLGRPPESAHHRILVVGSANLDTYLTSPSLPQAGQIANSHDLTTIPGGKGVNQSVGVARLGQPVSLIASVGADRAADRIYQTLDAAGVDTQEVKRRAGADTGRVYIFVDQEGKSLSSRIIGANALLSPEDIHQADKLFSRAAYCLIQTVIPLSTVKEACLRAHQHGAQTIVKPFFCKHLPADILRECDFLIPSATELDTLYPGSDSRAAKAAKLLEAGVKNVIVTTGQAGCTLYRADGSQDFPTTPVEIVDDTGAGDAFISALASYLLYGYSLEAAIDIANQAAGYSLTRQGVLPSLIDRTHLERLTIERRAEQSREGQQPLG